MTIRKTAVAVGAAFGISASLLAMIPAGHHSEAAIAVIDQKNIEEAIKTAIQTAKILSTEEKELALMILNSKKIGSAEIEKYVQMQGAQQKEIFDEKRGQEGVLGKIWVDKKGVTNPNPLDTVWRERLGDLQSILNGNTTVATGILNERRREETLAATFKDAAQSAQNTQQANLEIAKSTQEALNASNQAEGTMQVMQSGNAINANSVLALLQMTKMYSNAVAAEASHYQAENLRRATIELGDRRPSPEVAKRIAGVLGFASEWYRLLEVGGEQGNKKPANAG